jgi:hypothetical protein
MIEVAVPLIKENKVVDYVRAQIPPENTSEFWAKVRIAVTEVGGEIDHRPQEPFDFSQVQ